MRMSPCRRTARVWSVADGKPRTPPLEHRGSVTHAAFGPGGLLATGSADRTARVWDLASGELAASLPHRDAVRQRAGDFVGVAFTVRQQRQHA